MGAKALGDPDPDLLMEPTLSVPGAISLNAFFMLFFVLKKMGRGEADASRI